MLTAAVPFGLDLENDPGEGSWPLPPPEMSVTCPALYVAMSFRTMMLSPAICASVAELASSRPSRASGTTWRASLISFFVALMAIVLLAAASLFFN